MCGWYILVQVFIHYHYICHMFLLTCSNCFGFMDPHVCWILWVSECVCVCFKKIYEDTLLVNYYPSSWAAENHLLKLSRCLCLCVAVTTHTCNTHGHTQVNIFQVESFPCATCFYFLFILLKKPLYTYFFDGRSTELNSHN